MCEKIIIVCLKSVRCSLLEGHFKTECYLRKSHEKSTSVYKVWDVHSLNVTSRLNVACEKVMKIVLSFFNMRCSLLEGLVRTDRDMWKIRKKLQVLKIVRCSLLEGLFKTERRLSCLKSEVFKYFKRCLPIEDRW